MSNYEENPENEQDSNNKELRESNRNDESDELDKTDLEQQGPQKGDFNVLNHNGSLGDLPDPGAEGSGANEGSVA